MRSSPFQTNMNRSFILSLYVLVVCVPCRWAKTSYLCTSVLWQQGMPGHGQAFLREVVSWGRLILIPNLSETSPGRVRLHSVSQIVNSGRPWAVKGRCLSVHSSAEPYFPFRLLALLWEGIGGSFQGFATALL